MILKNRKTWEEDKGIWLSKERYPRQNKRFQPFINGCNMKGARWPRGYWRNRVRSEVRHRIEALWCRVSNPNWMIRTPAQEQLERDLEEICSPWR